MAMLALALTGIAQPAAAQDARACVNEVQRLSEAFPLIGGHGGRAGAAIAQAPGARKGAGLGEEQHRQIGDLVQEARAAGERGDGGGCLQRLAEARALLRQAGLGSRQPGSPSSAGSDMGGALGSGIPGAAGSLGGSPTTTRPGGMSGSTLGGTGGGASGGGGSSGGGGG
jgi:hypothetical protein